MAISTLIPLAGAAMLPLVGKVVEAVSDGLSFLNVLHSGGEQEPAEEESQSITSELEKLLSLGGGAPGLNIQESAQAALDKFQQKLRQKLSASGIDLSQPLQLRSDSLGGIYADHPQRAQIEQIFADDPELTSEFNALSATYGLLQAVEQHQATVAQMTGNPDLDAELLSRRRDELGDFGLLFNGEETEVFFE